MRLRLRLLPLRRLFGSVRMRLTLWYLAILAVVFLVFGVAVTVTVLHEGGVLCEGPVDRIQKDERVMEVYLGRSRDADE